MKIPGATILPPLLVPAEPAREVSSQVQAPLAKPAAKPVVQRPVTDVDQPAVIYLKDRYPSSAESSAVQGHARRALAAYESVEQLRARDDLRRIQGVDDFA